MTRVHNTHAPDKYRFPEHVQGLRNVPTLKSDTRTKQRGLPPVTKLCSLETLKVTRGRKKGGLYVA